APIAWKESTAARRVPKCARVCAATGARSRLGCLRPTLPPRLRRLGRSRAPLEQRAMVGDHLSFDAFSGISLGRLKERMPLRFTRHAEPPPHLAVSTSARFGAAGVAASLVLELERFDQLRCAV